MAFTLYTINGKLLVHNGKLIGKKTQEYDAVLENNTWAQIQSGLRAGNPANWQVGATKSVTLTDGNTYTARLVDLNKGRYKDVNNTANVAVFEFVELIKGVTHEMNVSKKTYGSVTNYTAGGWLNSDLRTYMNGSDLLGKFPTDLTSVMLNTQVGSASYSGSGQTDTTAGGKIIYSDGDKLFLATASEFFGSTHGFDYGTMRTAYPQFDYYKAHNTNNDRVKHELGSTLGVAYWNRSPSYVGTYEFCTANNDGTASRSYANTSSNVCPCFAL